MEQQIVKKLNWYYYGIMVLTLISVVVMYLISDNYAKAQVTLAEEQGIAELTHDDVTMILPNSQLGMIIQYFVIFYALIAIPLGLYLIKWRKPTEYEPYYKLAKYRIFLVGMAMPLGVVAFYILGSYQSMIWITAIGAIAWYFTKPTIGKVEKEMTPPDPNIPTY